jgi:hypothetical protein
MKKMTNEEWQAADGRLSRSGGRFVFNPGLIQGLLTSAPTY